MMAAPCLARDKRALGEEGLPGILSVPCGWKVLHHKAVNSPLLSSDMPSPWHSPWMSAFHWDMWWLHYWFMTPTEKLFIRFGFYYPTIITGLNLYCLGFFFLLHLPYFSTFQHPFALSTYHLAIFIVVTIAFRSAKPEPVCFIVQILLSLLLFVDCHIYCIFPKLFLAQQMYQWGEKYEWI